jgi:Family of unknown function (DUF6281)
MGPRRFVIALAALLTACGFVVGPASGSCAFVIEWDGVVYDSPNIDQSPRFGPSLGEGTVPACDDTETGGGCDRLHGEDDQSIAIYRLPGVDPHVAFGAVTPWGDREPFLAAGFFPQLPGHPLHEAIFGSPNRPSERSGPWHCGDPITNLVGTVTSTSGVGRGFGARFEGNRVRRQYDYTAVAVDAKTTVTGFDEFGIPHIAEGDTLHATVRECTASGERYQVVADSIER